MAKLLLKLLLLLFIILCVSSFFAYTIINSERFSDYFAIYKEADIYEVLSKSKKPSKASTVFLGDSVGRQLFSEIDENINDIVDLTSNQAISMAGQYVLLTNILKCNKNIKQVYLICIPDSFRNNLDQIYTYNYFVKPFYNSEHEIFYTKATAKIINAKPYSFLYNLPISRVLPAFNTIDYSRPKQLGDLFSDTSIEYLKLMKALCASHNIKLKALPAPLSEEKSKQKVSTYEKAKKQLNENNLNDIFEDYFGSIIVLNNNVFLDDLVHFNRDNLSMISIGTMVQYGFNLKSECSFNGGFHGEEKVGHKKFRWVRNNAEVTIYNSIKNMCQVEITIINPSISPKLIKIYYNNNFVHKAVIANNSFNNAETVKFTIADLKSPNNIRLVSSGPEIRYPKDARKISYGIILPLRITAVPKSEM